MFLLHFLLARISGLSCCVWCFIFGVGSHWGLLLQFCRWQVRHYSWSAPTVCAWVCGSVCVCVPLPLPLSLSLPACLSVPLLFLSSFTYLLIYLVTHFFSFFHSFIFSDRVSSSRIPYVLFWPLGVTRHPCRKNTHTYLKNQTDYSSK